METDKWIQYSIYNYSRNISYIPDLKPLPPGEKVGERCLNRKSPGKGKGADALRVR